VTSTFFGAAAAIGSSCWTCDSAFATPVDASRHDESPVVYS
jgi:hypothetical protein